MKNETTIWFTRIYVRQVKFPTWLNLANIILSILKWFGAKTSTQKWTAVLIFRGSHQHVRGYTHNVTVLRWLPKPLWPEYKFSRLWVWLELNEWSSPSCVLKRSPKGKEAIHMCLNHLCDWKQWPMCCDESTHFKMSSAMSNCESFIHWIVNTIWKHGKKLGRKKRFPKPSKQTCKHLTTKKIFYVVHNQKKHYVFCVTVFAKRAFIRILYLLILFIRWH